jgi:hypothetical protein
MGSRSVTVGRFGEVRSEQIFCAPNPLRLTESLAPQHSSTLADLSTERVFSRKDRPRDHVFECSCPVNWRHKTPRAVTSKSGNDPIQWRFNEAMRRIL